MFLQATRALAHPIYDPRTYDIRPLSWGPDRRTRAVISVNIGQE
jgi:hypothetical protein